MLLFLLLLLCAEANQKKQEHGCTAPDTACQLPSDCRRIFGILDENYQQRCNINSQPVGVCCPLKFKSPLPLSVVQPLSSRSFQAPPQNRLLDAALAQAEAREEAINELEQRFQCDGSATLSASAESKHLALFSRDPILQQHHRRIRQAFEALDRLGITNDPPTSKYGAPPPSTASGQRDTCGELTDEEKALFRQVIDEQFIQPICPKPPKCDFNSKYRTINGSCNNPMNPVIGEKDTQFIRHVRPAYFGGMYRPKNESKRGSALPLARTISTSISPETDRPLNGLSLLVMQWGQFLDHDLTRTAVNRGLGESGITCCNRTSNVIIESRRHPACLPIEIPETDVFYSRFNRRCMEFVRSLFAAPTNCLLTHAEQATSLTHYIDGSMVYGSEEKEVNDLREFRGGRLKALFHNDQELLPLNTTEVDRCENPPPGAFCFQAGDERVNEQIDLTLMHTIWLREHNRIANVLRQLNPYWNDETLYQETRRIVIAEIQHVTYNEWLPVVLGGEFTTQFNLNPKHYGYSYDYSPNVDASIANSFATAAFRFGHSLLQGTLELHGKKGVEGTIELYKNYNGYNLNRRGMFDALTRGLTRQRPQSFDRFFIDDVQNLLFQTNNLWGMDLVSLNIQRGRDHGLAGYNAYRTLCGLPKASSFEDFADFFSKEGLRTLKGLYEDVDDVDLFVGGVMETPVSGSILGPTFRCLVGDQFFRLKWGDRYFYDLGGRPHSFSEGQLNEIRKVTMARILCDNSDNIHHIQKNVFNVPSKYNPVVSCFRSGYEEAKIPGMNLKLWAGQHQYSNRPQVQVPYSVGHSQGQIYQPNSIPTQQAKYPPSQSHYVGPNVPQAANLAYG